MKVVAKVRLFVILLFLLTAYSPALPTLDVDEAHFTAFKQGEARDEAR